VAVRHLPSAILAAKDGRRANRDRRELIGPTDTRPESFDLDRVRKLGRDHRRDIVELKVLAVAIVGRRQVEPGAYLLPASTGGPNGLANVTSSRRDQSALYTSGLPLVISSPARRYSCIGKSWLWVIPPPGRRKAWAEAIAVIVAGTTSLQPLSRSESTIWSARIRLGGSP
jgi:hypothetical protein